MLIDIGNGFANLVEDRDFVDIMDKQISPEFARIVGDKLDYLRYIEAFEEEKYDGDYRCLEAENEELRNVIDDVNSELQQYVDGLEHGKRVYRETLLKMLKSIINQLNDRL